MFASLSTRFPFYISYLYQFTLYGNFNVWFNRFWGSLIKYSQAKDCICVRDASHCYFTRMHKAMSSKMCITLKQSMDRLNRHTVCYKLRCLHFTLLHYVGLLWSVAICKIFPPNQHIPLDKSNTVNMRTENQPNSASVVQKVYSRQKKRAKYKAGLTFWVLLLRFLLNQNTNVPMSEKCYNVFLVLLSRRNIKTTF